MFELFTLISNLLFLLIFVMIIRFIHNKVIKKGAVNTENITNKIPVQAPAPSSKLPQKTKPLLKNTLILLSINNIITAIFLAIKAAQISRMSSGLGVLFLWFWGAILFIILFATLSSSFISIMANKKGIPGQIIVSFTVAWLIIIETYVGSSAYFTDLLPAIIILLSLATTFALADHIESISLPDKNNSSKKITFIIFTISILTIALLTYSL